MAESGTTVNPVVIVTAVSTSSAVAQDPNYDALVRQYLELARSHSTTIPIVVNPSTNPTVQPVAPWLGDVERRLNASIGISGGSDQQTGAALRREVVSAANSFFSATSVVLPNEPHLYGLPTGDLVAEFTAEARRMTIVFTNDAALAMTTVAGKSVHKQFALQAADPSALRRDLAALIASTGTDSHGSMDPGR